MSEMCSQPFSDLGNCFLGSYLQISRMVFPVTRELENKVCLTCESRGVYSSPSQSNHASVYSLFSGTLSAPEWRFEAHTHGRLSCPEILECCYLEAHVA